ncbi:MAG: GlsB/YeaQ/YmgE family stress response membrane protein [Cyanobacteriota bacterium]|nr:GlsB/YeaQ/YmgE family stress response membrane protein [Cyanobacteriota bacterium]
MTILTWVIVGLLAAAIAKAYYPGGGGFRSTAIWGITGALAGGLAAIYLISNGSLPITLSLLTARGIIVGSILPAVVCGFIAIVAFFVRNTFNQT